MALTEQLIKVAHSASKMTGVIGNSHLKSAKKTLAEKGFDVHCVTVGAIMDKEEKRRIERAFRIIRTMLNSKD